MTNSGELFSSLPPMDRPDLTFVSRWDTPQKQALTGIALRSLSLYPEHREGVQSSDTDRLYYIVDEAQARGVDLSFDEARDYLNRAASEKAARARHQEELAAQELAWHQGEFVHDSTLENALTQQDRRDLLALDKLDLSADIFFPKTPNKEPDDA